MKCAVEQVLSNHGYIHTHATLAPGTSSTVPTDNALYFTGIGGVTLSPHFQFQSAHHGNGDDCTTPGHTL